MKNTLNTITTFFKYGAALIILVALITSLNPFVNVSAGQVGVVFDKLRGGVQEKTLGEGLHFRMPFFQNIVEIPIRTQKVVFINQSNARLAYNQVSKFSSGLRDEYTQELGSMLAASSDLQDVYVDAVVTYHLNPSAVHKIYQEVGSDYESKKVVPRAIDSVKTFTAKYKVADILTKREEIKNKVFEDLRTNLEKDDIILEDINLTNFDFNQQFKTAIEQKQIEEQKAQKEEYVLQQIEISSQQQVKKAEAEKQARILEGEGIAKYNESIQREITPEVLEYKRLENARAAIEKWDGAYPQTYFGEGGGAVPLINLQPKEVQP